jgi:FdhE protein
LLGKWFRGGANTEVTEAVADLATLATQRPSLSAPCAVLQECLPLLFADAVEEASPQIDAETAGARLAQAIPLFRDAAILVDSKSLRRRWLGICEAVARHNNENARQVARQWKTLDPPALLAEVLSGRTDAVHSRADGLHLDAALVGTVFRLAVFPVLAHHAAVLAVKCSTGCWQQGYCPLCGSWPLLAEIRGLEQLRFLRCGLCAAEWSYPRLGCPFCGCRDHRQLGFFHVAREENRYRVATCEACRGYVRTTNTLAALTPVQLLVADLATLHLELAAADRGNVVLP